MLWDIPDQVALQQVGRHYASRRKNNAFRPSSRDDWFACVRLQASEATYNVDALSAGPVGMTRRGEKLGPCERQRSFHRSPSTTAA